MKKIHFGKLEGYSIKYYNQHKKIKPYFIASIDLDSNETIQDTTIDGFISQLKELEESIDIYFHNGSAYDFHFLLPTLLEIYGEDKVNYFINENKRILNIKIKFRTKKKKFTITFKDSRKIWPISLEQLGEVVGVKRVEDLNYDISTIFNSTNEYMEFYGGIYYNKTMTDLQILKTFAIQTKDIIDIRDFKLTLPSTSKKLAIQQNRVLAKIDTWINDIEEWMIVRKAYKGGYVYNKPGTENKLLKDIYTYDVNSLFPSIMEQEKLPFGEVSYEDLPSHTYKVYAVEIKKATAKMFPFIPSYEIDIQQNLSEKYEKVLEDKFIYLNNYELEYFEKMYEGEWTKTFIMNYKEKYDMFSKYITYWKEIKENNGGAIRQLAKLMLNSLYGKFGQKPIYSQVKYKGNEYIKQQNDERQNLSYLPLTEAIASKARIVLYKAIEDNWENFIYCDTDSMHLTKEATNIEIDDNEFGKWKLEGISQEAIYKQPKHYMLIENGIQTIKGSGLDVKNLNKTQQLSKEEYMKDEFIVENGKIVSSIVNGGVIIYTQNYTYKRSKLCKNTTNIHTL